MRLLLLLLPLYRRPLSETSYVSGRVKTCTSMISLEARHSVMWMCKFTHLNVQGSSAQPYLIRNEGWRVGSALCSCWPKILRGKTVDGQRCVIGRQHAAQIVVADNKCHVTADKARAIAVRMARNSTTHQAGHVGGQRIQ